MSERAKANCKFYDALKNSQPIAFLASLSMVIATFSYSNHELPNVYTNAVLASMTFLISFVLSLIDQINLENDRDIPVVHWGKFFFLAVGILYLIVVAVEFSKSLTQIYYIFSGWSSIAIGGSFLVSLLSKKGRLKPSSYEKQSEYKYIELCWSVFSMGFIILGLLIIGQGFITYPTSKTIIDSIYIGIFGVTLSAMILGVLFMNQYDKKNKSSNKSQPTP